MVLPVRLNEIRLDFDSINLAMMDSCSFLTFTTATVAGARTGIRAWTWAGIRAWTVAGTVAFSVAVTTADTAAKTVTVTALTAAAMTVAVAAAVASAVAASISATAAVTAASAISTTTASAVASAGQDDPGIEGVIGRHVQIRSEAFPGARRIDMTGCRTPGRYCCQK
jgi:hypothetical protein